MNKLPKLHLACSQDDLRPAMQGVLIDGNNAVATNGHILVVAEIASFITKHENLDGKLLDSSTWQLICDSSFIEANDDHIRCVYNGCVIKLPYEGNEIVGEQFPDYKNILPDKNYGAVEGTNSIRFNTKYVDALRRTMRQSPSSEQMTFYMRDRKSMIVVTCQDFDGIAILMPIMMNGYTANDVDKLSTIEQSKYLENG